MVFLDSFFLFLITASEEASSLLKDDFGPGRSNSNVYILAECKQKIISTHYICYNKYHNLIEITHEMSI